LTGHLTGMKQIPLAIGPEPLPTFDSYVGGPNVAALEHLRQLRPPAPPVYLWGPGGSGKTHLLRALAWALEKSGASTAWFDAAHPLPWALSPTDRLMVIDRADQLDSAAQQAAFALFVDAGTHGVQVAAAGRLPPVDLPLRDDLRSRLGWGHVFALHAVADAQARAVLHREAARRGIALGDDLLNHLLTRFDRDLGHLMALLDRLDQFALSRARPVTLPLLRLMLAEDAATTEAARTS
jgi:DnaA-homolog protein